MRDDGYGLRFEAALDGTWKSSVDGAPEYPTNWKLLKLHGSTNWLVPYLYVNFETLEYASAVPTSDNVFLYWQSTMPYGTHKNRWKGGYASTCYCYYPPNIPEPLFTQEQLSLQPGHVLAKFVSKGIFAPFNEMDSAGVPASPLLITPVRQKKIQYVRDDN